MKLMVNQLAKLSGVSVRTLHYYDEIGLLEPAFVQDNGFRVYEEKEVLLLQQILFFRELEFSLEQIKKIVHSKDFKPIEALEYQRNLLELKKKRTEEIIKTIDITINNMKGGETMKNDDMFNALSDKQMEEYKEEAKKRWGNTEAYKQSELRTKNWTKDDYKRIQDPGNKLTQEIADNMDKGVKSQEIQALIDKHHKGIEVFYDCSMEMYRGLGNMYVEDPRFTAFYEKFAPGLAIFMRDAIEHYCDTHKDK